MLQNLLGGLGALAPNLGQVGQIPGQIGGLLANEGGAMTNLTQNPAFNMGVGLLDPNQGISQAVLGGLTKAKQAAQSDEDRQRNAQLREQLMQLITGQMGGDVQTPTEQTLQQSLIPGMAGSGVAGQLPGAAPGAPGRSPFADYLGGADSLGGLGATTTPALDQARTQAMNAARESLIAAGEVNPSEKDIEMMMELMRANQGM